MAQWKIEMKQSGTINSVRIEKGMFVEYVTNNTTPPLTALSKNKEAIGMLFKNKYGIDVLKANLVSASRMSCTRIK